MSFTDFQWSEKAHYVQEHRIRNRGSPVAEVAVMTLTRQRTLNPKFAFDHDQGQRIIRKHE